MILRATGKVQWFNVRNGYGVIRREHGENDYLLRYSAIQGTIFQTLASGQRVEFDIIPGATGPTAQNVIRLA